MATADASADCPFCAIARGDAPATIVASSDEWVAFFPEHPATRGHTLLIPRRHVVDYWAAPDDVTRSLAVACSRIGNAVRRALDPDGVNLITSAGAAAEQTIFHLHLHVVPRWLDDGFGSIWPPKTHAPDFDIDDTRLKLARALRD